MSDVLLCTASILNLCAISIDRYFIILHAMVYTQRRNAQLMLLMIVTVWLISGLISIPPLFGWSRPSSRLELENVCAVSSDLKYQIFATLLAFYLPLIVMIIIYLNIYRAAKKLKQREAETNGQLQYSLSTSFHRESLSASNTVYADLSNKFKGITHQLKSTSLSENCSIEYKSRSQFNPKESLTSHSQASKLFGDKDNGQGSHVIYGMSRRLTRHLVQVFYNMKRNSHGSNTQRKNQKATKALGVIMGCFILCWLPFFIMALLKPIRLSNGQLLGDFVPKWLDSLLLWLGYFNSALNPMIYARFNREFRRPFVEILCFRCCHINDKLRDYERKKIFADTNSKLNKQPFLPKPNSQVASSHSANAFDALIQNENVASQNKSLSEHFLHELVNESDDAAKPKLIRNSLDSSKLTTANDDDKTADTFDRISTKSLFTFNRVSSEVPIIVCSESDSTQLISSIRKTSFCTTASSITYDSSKSVFQSTCEQCFQKDTSQLSDLVSLKVCDDSRLVPPNALTTFTKNKRLNQTARQPAANLAYCTNLANKIRIEKSFKKKCFFTPIFNTSYNKANSNHSIGRATPRDRKATVEEFCNKKTTSESTV